MELSNLKILIADDHKLFAEGLTYLLKQELSIESIDTVYNGKSAIGKVLNTDYNIIIMDVNMPLLNGIETCAEIKRFRTQTKIVFVSMKADMLTVAQALKAGADAYLLKGND
ncbi:MAG TPA: response regulator transcription factor, partial [Bacteroidia bacterium]|nr:response regulator transcription factor [Bacteroidia bacterium]